MLKKILILGGVSLTLGLTGGFIGKAIYDVCSKPEGYLVVDDDATPYLNMNKYPGEFKNHEKIILEVQRLKISTK